MHSRTINLTCCSSSEVAAAFGPLPSVEAASASEVEEFSLGLLAFLLLDLLDDAEAVDRCVT